MNYEAFKSSAITSIQNYFGETARVSLHPITKNNNIQLDGLTIQEPSAKLNIVIFGNWV